MRTGRMTATPPFRSHRFGAAAPVSQRPSLQRMVAPAGAAAVLAGVAGAASLDRATGAGGGAARWIGVAAGAGCTTGAGGGGLAGGNGAGVWAATEASGVSSAARSRRSARLAEGCSRVIMGLP